MTFLACALHQLFVRSCDFPHHGLYCSLVCACTHQISLQHLCLVFAFVIFSSQMEEQQNIPQQNIPQPHGTTWWNHFCYTGIRLSAPHSLQQLQAGASSPPSMQMSASTRVSHGAAPSSSVSCPQVTLSAAHPQVQLDPTRTITSDPLSATLAEAATQLSFAAFLERCIFVRPSYQSPPHFWMPPRRLFHASLSLRTFLRNSRSRSSLSDAFTRIIRRVLAPPSTYDVLCFWTWLCRRLCTASHLTMPPHNYRSRSSSSGASFPTFLLDRQALPSAHCNAGSASPPQPADKAALCSPNSTSHASDGHEDTTPHECHHSRLWVSRSMPVSAPHMACLLTGATSRLCTCMSFTPPQPHVCTTQVGTHPVRPATASKRSASTALAVTHNPVGADPRAGTGPFPEPRTLVLPTVKFGQSKPHGLGYIDTVDSDLMHHQYRLPVLQWNPGPARRTPPILSRRHVESSTRLSFKEPVIMSRTSLISSLRTLATRTSPSCSTRTPSSPTQWYGPTHRSRPAATPFTFWYSDSYILFCAHPQCSGQET